MDQLTQVKRRPSVHRVQPAANMRSILRVAVGVQEYGIDMAQVAVIEDADRLAETYPSSDGVGVMTHEGAEIPVYWLADRMGLPQPAFRRKRSSRCHAVVVQGRRPPWAFLVEETAPVVQTPRERVHALPRICGEPGARLFSDAVDLSPAADPKAATFPIRSDQTMTSFTMARDLLLLVDLDWIHPDSARRAAETAAPAPQRRDPLVEGPLAAGRRQLLTFVVSGALTPERPVAIGLSIGQILEILEPAQLLSVPTAPSFCRGLLLWRERMVPILDLAARLGLPPGEYQRERFVVARVNAAGDLAGFGVQPNVQTLRLPCMHRPSDEPLAIDLSLGSFELDGRTLIVPDLAAAALCN